MPEPTKAKDLWTKLKPLSDLGLDEVREQLDTLSDEEIRMGLKANIFNNPAKRVIAEEKLRERERNRPEPTSRIQRIAAIASVIGAVAATIAAVAAVMGLIT